MIGFIILTVLSATLISPGCGQDYDDGRATRVKYRHFEDDVELAKPAPTVVPILKQIDRHNEDGSYTYGFEAADGSFKIETKQANGEVKGKYGYTDATGKLHVVEYGANKYGFQPSGEGITVPPINLNAEPEPEYEEEVPRKYQVKPSQLRPRPAVVQQQPRIWEQPAEVRAPVPAPIQPISAPARPKPATPHIIYNSPTPKRPAFFAGAQPVQEAPSQYEYDEPIAPKPVQRPVQKPQAVKAQTIATFSRPATEQPAYFIPSSQFRQRIQFSDPSDRASPVTYDRPEPPAQIFRPEPKVQFDYAEPEQAYRQEEVRSYVPKPAPKPSSRSGGFLDQLQEQFSLPQGGNPTHNIAFGFY